MKADRRANAEPQAGGVVASHGSNGHVSQLACGEASGSRKGPSVGECMCVVYSLTGLYSCLDSCLDVLCYCKVWEHVK